MFCNEQADISEWSWILIFFIYQVHTLLGNIFTDMIITENFFYVYWVLNSLPKPSGIF
jgi:hypothetical protein